MNDTDSLSPAEALARAHDSSAAARRAGLRWRIVGWWVLTAFMIVHMLGQRLYNDFLDDWTLVFLGATVLILCLLALTARVHDRRSTRIEIWFIGGMVVVSLLAAVIYNLLIPDGVTVWAFGPALLPIGLCTAVTVWSVRR